MKASTTPAVMAEQLRDDISEGTVMERVKTGSLSYIMYSSSRSVDFSRASADLLKR